MFAIFKKEINTFFSTSIGYLIIILFLLINSLLMWVFPSYYNVLDSGYSQMDSLFIFAPLIFLIFIPAITMRLFSEEQKTGTIEIILTKPISEIELIIAKYLSGLILIILSIIPTIIYYISIYFIGEIKGNIDTPGIIGSYIGLFFLSSGFVSIGLFCSILSKNQIISFILSLLISSFFYLGFDIIASFINNGDIEILIENLSINYHYQSLSKGVIDSRDLVYFISINIFFILLSKNVLINRKFS